MRRDARLLLAGGLLLGGLAACREADRPVGPPEGAAVVVESDPAGAEILLDDRATGQKTPGVVRGVPAGRHRVLVRLDTAGLTYGYVTEFELLPPDTQATVFGPLMLGCCVAGAATNHETTGLRFTSNASGPLLFVDGQGRGLIWPAQDGNSYASVAQPVFAATVRGAASRAAVALGPYDPNYLVGRPAPRLEPGGGFRLRQSFWVLPPSELRRFHTVRGLEVREEVVARAELEGTLLVRLTFRNVTAEPVYRSVDPAVPEAGLTYENAWIGLALDGDVGTGQGGPSDDLLSYAPELGLAFIYDYDFREASFGTAWAERPGLVGLRLVERPTGTVQVLNGWPGGTAAGTVDWRAGTPTEASGLAWLSAGETGLSDHPDASPELRLGHAPTAAADMRVLAAAGPLTLAPGDSARIVVAIMVAEPEAGSFSSGRPVPPGADARDSGREILRIAARLLAKARNATRFE